MQEIVKLAECLYCGVPAIDEEHTSLLNLLNELKFAEHKDVDMLVIRICDAINQHSTIEEHIMHDVRYDDFAMILHIADHHTQFAEIKEDVAHLNIDAAIRKLAKHIAKYDVPLGKFVMAKQKMIDTSQ